MTKEQLKEILEDSLKNCTADVQSDDNVHFAAIIVTEEFNDIKSKVKRQQLVYSKINEYILSGELHALSMKTIAANEQ
ncbi:BolA/IbaG family iron-sulfur metabolism protein [Allofrancisella guangzhouensis]|uniref:BolA family transcriptional regulator n=1 Tax=Allofrancisella guangzhouensis TaxID=594679 RepID=A0A0A8E237_9GAMM|nr:BolA/IbaG family iron-sulfur metabolism protein [Allofrancisella guangzhouensis]AJC48275.1 BolA family transcriptional regulator [Allofrancisella guangzhouensis]MBK2026639.1 BolA/IbaG family iron-sulfur metabolism protein [Allofrancisella guangzhouensis]MBK2043426.1 BolA/IbaG family iron-sulfur metabolism protein [Allofrancisella guangzhouensis]MBK2045626.1 BolA/IbaG family iron-sulfur metabolism protein [Allofrancisella guangzhouensis]